MKRIVSFCFLVACLTACNESFVGQDGTVASRFPSGELTSLTAKIGDRSGTRTELREADGKILWGEYDRISVYAGSTERSVFQAEVNTEATSATFTGKLDLSGLEEGGWIYAVYPCSDRDSCRSGMLSVPIGGERNYYSDIQQTLTAQYVIPHNLYEFPMVARSQDSELSFFNVCGGIRFTVANEQIIAVIFKNLDGSPIAGDAQVTFDAEGHPAIGFILNGMDEIWTRPGYEDDDYPFFLPGEPFYLALPPKTYADGMTVTFRTPSTEATYTIPGGFEIKRSVFSQLLNRDSGLEFKPVEGNIPFEDETFKTYCVGNFDTNGDGEISDAEALAVTSIKFYETDHLRFDLGSLSELVYFENLTRLTVVPSKDEIGAGGLGYLDLAYFPKLQILQCYDNKISELDFTHTPDLYYLDIGGNRLSTLDVSCLPKLRVLYCRSAGLRSLTLPEESILEDLWVDRNSLEALHLAGQDKLNRLLCDDNEELVELDLSGLKNLKRAYCNRCSLERVYVNDCSSLELLGLDNNALGSLDVSGAPQLKYLYYTYNSHLSPNLSLLPGLEELYCDGNNLSSLDISNNPALKELSCSANALTGLDLSGKGNLYLLECHTNDLTALDVSGNPLLETLRCGGNYFTSLDVSHNSLLTLLDCVTSNRTEEYVSPLATIYIAAGQSIANLTKPAATTVSEVSGTTSQQAVRRAEARHRTELVKASVE